MRHLAVLAALAVLVLACGGGAAQPSASPAPTTALSEAERKYRIIDELGRPSFCDPDFYPVARADEGDLAQSRFPEIDADGPTLRAIVAHERMVVTLQFPTVYSPEQKVQIYRQWKLLNAIRLGPDGSFSLRVIPAGQDAKSVVALEGRVDRFGRLTIASRTQAVPAPCPICLALGTSIDTPLGPRAVETLHLGDPIWTVSADGSQQAATVAALGSVPAPQGHLVVALVLSDGRAVQVSPGHPTADGRTVGALGVGDAYDGATVVGATRVPYGGTRTYDLLASGATGRYWANGIALGSTLR